MAIINIMAVRHSAFYAPLLMTIKGGYLAKQGLEAAYSVASPENPIEENLRAGRVQLSQSAPALSFSALEQGREIDIVHFASINRRDGFFLTMRHATERFQWSDLEGRSVLVDHLFQPFATLRYAMFLHQADFDKMHIIDAGNVDQMDAAYRAAQGDFVHLQGPAAQQLIYEGLGQQIVSIGEAIGPLAFSSLCATREWLETDMALAFLAAYQQGMQAVIDKSAREIGKIIGDFLPGIESDVLVQTLKDYKALGTWQANTEIDEESYTNLLKVFLHSGYIREAHPMESCVQNLTL